MKYLESVPKKDGFWMPGEFEAHIGCWMLWPERTDNWRLGAKPAQEAFVKVAEAISSFEPVTVGVSANQYENATNQLPSNVRVVEISADDSWARDSGPTFVRDGNGTVRGVDWEFNAWGGLVDGLYFPWDQDEKVAHKICEIERLDSYKTKGFVLEGGSIHVDGEGTLYTTEECLLHESRNPHLNKRQIEETLTEYLGIKKVIWLKRGIYNDETNGHVDNILCVVKPGTVMLAWTEDRSDAQYEISSECLKILESETDAKGRKIEVIKMPLPKPILITEEESGGVDMIGGTLPRQAGDRLAASYVNFYIANGGVVFPLFGDPNDKLAEEALKKAFPDRKVVGIAAREILLGGGNIHCITQQQPKGA
jgi:agmatine deiminase